jgi:hypothetical protein
MHGVQSPGGVEFAKRPSTTGTLPGAPPSACQISRRSNRLLTLGVHGAGRRRPPQLGHASAEMTRRYQRQRDRFRVNLTKAAGL